MPTSVLHLGMVDAHHREAVERDVLDEGAEGLLDRVEGAVVVEVLGVDVGDDRDVGRQLEEGAVGLVGLDHHPVARAHAGVGAVGVDDAAVDDGRVESRRRRAASRRARSWWSCRACRRSATQDLKRISSASISARRTTGRRRSRAATSSGLSRLDRGRDDDDLGARRVLGGVADEGRRCPSRAGA